MVSKNKPTTKKFPTGTGLGGFAVKSWKIRVKYTATKYGTKHDTIFLRDPISTGWLIGRAQDGIDKYSMIKENDVIDALTMTKYDVIDHKITNATISFYDGWKGNPFKTIKF